MKKKAKPASRKTARPAAKKSASSRSPAARKKTARPATRAAKTKRAAKKTPADIDNLGELPRGYGDEGIFVIAQEPHWLFCYWDYQLTEKVGGEVFLRHGRSEGGQPEGEVAVPGESNSWYLPVRDADADYFVELGCYRKGRWKTLARSGAVLTPRDTVSGFGQPVFASTAIHSTFQHLVENLRNEMREGETETDVLARWQKRGKSPLGRLSPAQRIALDRLLQADLGASGADFSSYLGSPGGGISSRGAAPSSWDHWENLSSAALSFESGGASWQTALGAWSAPSSWLSSWGSRGFFMHVNAEVIFYGGTHPDAKVTIDGKPVALRPDGTFRHHFVFPDGEFEIPIVATSPDGVETRRAVLRFERATGRTGDVGSTAQPPLEAPMGRKKR